MMVNGGKRWRRCSGKREERREKKKKREQREGERNLRRRLAGSGES